MDDVPWPLVIVPADTDQLYVTLAVPETEAVKVTIDP
jgi:hypothetical protein